VGFVSRLVLLNGPPGIGKSTLSALYADRHPGTLNLDIDSLHDLVGGWRDIGGRVHDILRPLALAMAAAHLRGGRDVVVPQYLARVDEITAFEDVARDQAAEFGEVVLLDTREEAIERFARRAQHDDDPWIQHGNGFVARWGGPALLGSMYDALLDIVRLRPAAVVVRSGPGAVEETYRLVVEALS
jgi:predicted kinase